MIADQNRASLILPTSSGLSNLFRMSQTARKNRSNINSAWPEVEGKTVCTYQRCSLFKSLGSIIDVAWCSLAAYCFADCRKKGTILGKAWIHQVPWIRWIPTFHHDNLMQSYKLLNSLRHGHRFPLTANDPKLPFQIRQRALQEASRMSRGLLWLVCLHFSGLGNVWYGGIRHASLRCLWKTNSAERLLEKATSVEMILKGASKTGKGMDSIQTVSRLLHKSQIRTLLHRMDRVELCILTQKMRSVNEPMVNIMLEYLTRDTGYVRRQKNLFLLQTEYLEESTLKSPFESSLCLGSTRTVTDLNAVIGGLCQSSKRGQAAGIGRRRAYPKQVTSAICRKPTRVITKLYCPDIAHFDFVVARVFILSFVLWCCKPSLVHRQAWDLSLPSILHGPSD